MADNDHENGEDIIEAAPDPLTVALFGGISGISTRVPEFVLCDGLVVRNTYAHVMAPYVMAFGRPRKRGAPHPGPWKSVRGGGLGFDVTIEIALEQECEPTSFDRLNTLWWVLALLRLISAAPLRMPVVSDMSFSAISSSNEDPNLWPLEMSFQQLRIARDPLKEITVENLQWVKEHFIDCARLMDTERFNRAFQTFDSASWAHSMGSAIVMVWAALETLFRPGRQSITKVLAKTIATFLYPAGPDRDRAYQTTRELYEARGSAAHDSQHPEIDQFFGSFQLALYCFKKCMEIRAVPDTEDLLTRWKEGR